MNFLRRNKRTPVFPPATRTNEEWETLRRYLILRGANPHMPAPEMVAPGFTFDPGTYPGAVGSAPTVTLRVKVKVPDEFVRELPASDCLLHADPVDLCYACSKHANSHD